MSGECDEEVLGECGKKCRVSLREWQSLGRVVGMVQKTVWVSLHNSPHLQHLNTFSHTRHTHPIHSFTSSHTFPTSPHFPHDSDNSPHSCLTHFPTSPPHSFHILLILDSTPILPKIRRCFHHLYSPKFFIFPHSFPYAPILSLLFTLYQHFSLFSFVAKLV